MKASHIFALFIGLIMLISTMNFLNAEVSERATNSSATDFEVMMGETFPLFLGLVIMGFFGTILWVILG